MGYAHGDRAAAFNLAAGVRAAGAGGRCVFAENEW